MQRVSRLFSAIPMLLMLMSIYLLIDKRKTNDILLLPDTNSSVHQLEMTFVLREKIEIKTNSLQWLWLHKIAFWWQMDWKEYDKPVPIPILLSKDFMSWHGLKLKRFKFIRSERVNDSYISEVLSLRYRFSEKVARERNLEQIQF